MAQFFLRNSPDYRPTLVVQTCKQADEQAIQSFKELLLQQGCAHGILFDPHHCHILNDNFTAMDEDSFELETTLATDSVLKKMERPGVPRPASLDRRVELWLHQLSAKWEDAISDDPEIARWFYTDIILNAAQARIAKRADAKEESAA